MLPRITPNDLKVMKPQPDTSSPVVIHSSCPHHIRSALKSSPLHHNHHHIHLPSPKAVTKSPTYAPKQTITTSAHHLGTTHSLHYTHRFPPYLLFPLLTARSHNHKRYGFDRSSTTSPTAQHTLFDGKFFGGRWSKVQDILKVLSISSRFSRYAKYMNVTSIIRI